jgi:hypothetical protein
MVWDLMYPVLPVMNIIYQSFNLMLAAMKLELL